MLNTLSKKLQLHEKIKIIYVVDGYIATFLALDGQEVIAKAHGESVFDALDKLNQMTEVKNYKRGR